LDLLKSLAGYDDELFTLYEDELRVQVEFSEYANVDNEHITYNEVDKTLRVSMLNSYWMSGAFVTFDVNEDEIENEIVFNLIKISREGRMDEMIEHIAQVCILHAEDLNDR